MRASLSVLLIGLAAVLGGCVRAPDYTRPQAPVPGGWPTGAAYTGAGAPPAATDTPLPAWRELLPDERLRQLIDTALANNRDLRLAALNVERASAVYGIRRADLWPAASVVGSAAVQRLPADLSSTRTRHTSERYDVSLGVLSWEIDFAGRLRNLKDNALQDYLATEQAQRSAELLLVSSVANAYLALAADREGLKLAQTTLETQKGAYQLAKRRFDQGLVPELDTYRAQTQVDVARGDVARFTQLTAQGRNALALLVGAPVSEDLLPTDLATVAPPTEVAPGLSSEVLLQRPDVLQAEYQLRAAHADIAAARATFFPRVSLTSTLGTAGSELNNLFTGTSCTWSFVPQIVVPIFDARTWSAYRVAKVQREAALTRYEKAIQVAFRETADALAQHGTVGEQLAAQQSLVDATAAYHRLAEARYAKGVDNYLTVLDAQRTLYGAQQGLIGLRLAQYANRLTLYRVLGGG